MLKTGLVLQRVYGEAGGSLVVELDATAGGARCLHLGEPGQYRVLAVKSFAIAGE